MMSTPMSAPKRRPAAMHTRMRGGPPADWNMELKCEVGAESVELDVVDMLEGVGGGGQEQGAMRML